MGHSIANVLEFLETVLLHDLYLWDPAGTDEGAVRVIVREYPLGRQQALLTELDALLASSVTDEDLLDIALRARVNYLLDAANVRDWFAMIRDQVRIVVTAAS